MSSRETRKHEKKTTTLARLNFTYTSSHETREKKKKKYRPCSSNFVRQCPTSIFLSCIFMKHEINPHVNIQRVLDTCTNLLSCGIASDLSPHTHLNKSPPPTVGSLQLSKSYDCRTSIIPVTMAIAYANAASRLCCNGSNGSRLTRSLICLHRHIASVSRILPRGL